MALSLLRTPARFSSTPALVVPQLQRPPQQLTNAQSLLVPPAEARVTQRPPVLRQAVKPPATAQQLVNASFQPTSGRVLSYFPSFLDPAPLLFVSAAISAVFSAMRSCRFDSNPGIARSAASPR